MPRKRLTELPEGLWVKLAELEQYVRQLDMVRGFGWTMAVAAICVGGGLIADLTLELPLSFRVGLLVLTVCATLASAFWMMWRPWRRQRTDVDLASLVERSHPELKEGLVSCIELYDPSIPENERGSALMRELSAKQALQNVAPLDFCDSVSSRPAHLMAICGLLAWAMLLLPLIAPSSYRLLFARFLTPWENLDRVATFWFDVEQGDRVVVRGSDVTLTAHPRGSEQSFPETVNLNWIDGQGESNVRRVDFDGVQKVYATTIPHVMQDFDYYLTGAGNRSRNYRIRVVEAPAITSVKLQIQPPAYTGRPAKVLDGLPADIEVLEQTALNWKLTFNKPMVSAEWQWLQQSGNVALPANALTTKKKVADRKAEGKPDEGADDKVSLALSADKLSATWKDVASRSGEFRLVVRDEHGLSNEGDGTRVLTVTPDLAPTLSVSGNPEGETAKATDVVPVDVEAADDVGIGTLELHVEVDATRQQVVKADLKDPDGTTVRHRFHLELSALHLKDGELVNFRVRASDERPVPGPNETWSDRRIIRIDSQAKAPGTQQLAAEQSQLQEFLKQLKQDVSEQKETADKLQAQAEEAAKAAAPEELADAQERQKNIEQTADQQAQLQTRLEQLTAALDNHPLFANLTQQTRKLSEQEFTEAQKALSDAEQAETKQQPEKLQAAAQQLQQAESKLQALEQQLDKLAQLERDMLELDRLATNAEQLAERLRDLERRQQQPSPANETAQQKQTRDQIAKAEQNQLEAEQKELLQRADDLMNRQPELEQAARQKLDQQLRQLGQQAEQLAQPQQALADELQQAANQAADENQDLAEQHAELQQRAKDLQKELAQQPRPGVKPIDPEQIQKALDELAAGNLGEAAKEEERLAEKLDALEKQLRAADEQRAAQNERDQSAQAARELAKQQAKAAQAAREAAEKKQAPSDDQRAAADKQLAERQSQLEQIPAAEAAEEKQAAAKALQQAAEAQQAETKDQAEGPQKNAAAQQAAAEALQKLAEQLGQPSPNPKEPSAEKPEGQSSSKTRQAEPKPQPDTDPMGGEQGAEKPERSNPTADQVKQLAQEARQMQKQLEQTQQTQDLRGPQAQQQELNQALERLNADIEAALKRGQADGAPGANKPSTSLQQAQQAMEQAEHQLEEGNLEKAAAAARQSAEALQQASQPSPMNDEPPQQQQSPAGKPGDNSAPSENAAPPQKPMAPQAASDVADAIEQLKQALSAPPPAAQEQAGRNPNPKANDQTETNPANPAAAGAKSQEVSPPRQSPAGEPQASQKPPTPQNEGNQSTNQGPAQSSEPAQPQAATPPKNDARPSSAKSPGQPPAKQPAPASPVEAAAQRLQKAAESLREACAQCQKPGGGPGTNKSGTGEGQQPLAGTQPENNDNGQTNAAAGEPSAPNNQPGQGQAKGQQGKPGTKAGGSGKSGPDETAEVDGELARLKKRLKGRKWGELPGTLQTEILQAAQKKPNSEYADLIRQYFKEIAKTQPVPVPANKTP